MEAARSGEMILRFCSAGKNPGVIEFTRDAKIIYSAQRSALHRLWSDTSWRISRVRENPATADAEFDRLLDEFDQQRDEADRQAKIEGGQNPATGKQHALDSNFQSGSRIRHTLNLI